MDSRHRGEYGKQDYEPILRRPDAGTPACNRCKALKLLDSVLLTGTVWTMYGAL